MPGLILEGGTFRPVFSCGVLDALLDEGLMFDYVSGVSAGITYAFSYLAGQRGRNLRIFTTYRNDKRYLSMRNFRKCGSIFGLDFVFDEVPNRLVPFDYDTFAAFPGEVEAVVTNLNTGKAEYLPVPRRDEHFLLLQATCAMPLLFPVYHLDGMPCLDGGAADAIPYERAFEMGCDRVVVVLTRERSYRREPEKLQPFIDVRYRRYPHFCETMRRRAETYNASREHLFQLEREGKVLLFAPQNTQGFSRIERDVDKIRALWQDGYEQTKARAGEVRSFWGQ